MPEHLKIILKYLIFGKMPKKWHLWLQLCKCIKYNKSSKFNLISSRIFNIFYHMDQRLTITIPFQLQLLLYIQVEVNSDQWFLETEDKKIVLIYEIAFLFKFSETYEGLSFIFSRGLQLNTCINTKQNFFKKDYS